MILHDRHKYTVPNDQGMDKEVYDEVQETNEWFTTMLYHKKKIESSYNTLTHSVQVYKSIETK